MSKHFSEGERPSGTIRYSVTSLPSICRKFENRFNIQPKDRKAKYNISRWQLYSTILLIYIVFYCKISFS